MPELPEVETVRVALDRAMTGDVIGAVQLNRTGLRNPFAPDLAARMAGRTVTGVGRRGKYILVHLDRGDVFVLHLGMSGRVLLVPAGGDHADDRHDHIDISFQSGLRVIYNDARRFGMAFMLDEAGLKSYPAFATMGPEPLGNAFSGPVLAAALQGRKTTIKNALMDQRIVAGLGNIYVCEALYDAGISPLRMAATIRKTEAEALSNAIRAVLTRALAAGGSTLRDYRHANGDLGYFQQQLKVYGREGAPCPDCVCTVEQTGGIRRISQAGRSTFYCPQRQK